MTENVILTVRGHQTDLGEDATTELIAGAAYYYRNGKHYILYDEIDPESGEQSGNTIKIGEDRVDVIRRGAGKVHMVFEKEKQISSQYHTPAGVIQMEIFTSRLRTRPEGENIETEILYDLHMNDVFISVCSTDDVRRNIRISTKIFGKNKDAKVNGINSKGNILFHTLWTSTP